MNLIKLLLVCETEECNPKPGIATTKTIKQEDVSWCEEHRGAIIFWIGLVSIITLGVVPCIIGWAKILLWILN